MSDTLIQPIGEYYLPHQDVARRFGRSNRWALQHIHAGSFGDEVIEDGGDYLVPLSAYNAFVQARRIFDQSTGELKPIYAKSPEQAVRKLRGLRQGRLSARS